MKITVSYFKRFGKWYTDKEIKIPEPKIDWFRDKTDSELVLSRFYFRDWFYDEAQHDEFYGFVNIPKGSLEENMLGFPMMIPPKVIL